MDTFNHIPHVTNPLPLLTLILATYVMVTHTKPVADTRQQQTNLCTHMIHTSIHTLHGTIMESTQVQFQT